MSSIHSETTDRNRTFSVGIVVGMSLLIAAGVFAGFALFEISAGNLPNSYSDFRGTLKDGELWFSVLKTTGNPFFPSSEYRINRLNLQTGIVSETNSSAFNQRPVPVWVGNDLYVNVYGAVYRYVDQTFVALPPIDAVGRTVFEFEGRLTAVVPKKFGGYRLTHWDKNNWLPGRSIVLPNADLVWRHDSETNQDRLVPEDSVGNTTSKWQIGEIFVARHDQQYQVMIRLPNLAYSAYRTGFEFIDTDDDSDEAVSALTPENRPQEFTGWEPIAHDLKSRYWEYACDQASLLCISQHDSSRVVRRLADGSWVDLEIDNPSAWNGQRATIIANPSESASYVLLWDGRWSSGKICRIENQKVHAASITIPGYERAYVERWLRILAELFCVWILHILILWMGIQRVTQRTMTTTFDAGTRRARLATLGQRTVAMLIDAALIYGLIWFAWLLWQLTFFSQFSSWKLPTYDDLAISLLYLEEAFQLGNVRFSKFIPTFFATPFGWLVQPLDPSTGFFGAMMAILVVCGIVKCGVEGRYGITPGKWLMGIRTLGTKLRPCGTARVITRDVLRAVDFPLLLTPIPAVISLMYSGNHQRLGDRIAETMVVKTGSIEDVNF